MNKEVSNFVTIKIEARDAQIQIALKAAVRDLRGHGFSRNWQEVLNRTFFARSIAGEIIDGNIAVSGQTKQLAEELAGVGRELNGWLYQLEGEGLL